MCLNTTFCKVNTHNLLQWYSAAVAVLHMSHKSYQNNNKNQFCINIAKFCKKNLLFYRQINLIVIALQAAIISEIRPVRPGLAVVSDNMHRKMEK